VALQRWLALAGARTVIVPFAPILADLVPCEEVRMRRDFRQLLNAIEAVALVRQRQRLHTPDGAVIARVDDYATARKMLCGVFDAIVSDGVSRAIRQTVEAIKPDEAINRVELAERLHLAGSTVRWRVGRALKAGWLVEDRQDRTLKRGVALPSERTALPTPEEIQARVESSNSQQGGERPPSPEERATDQHAREVREL
jgi:hypothetical protein